MITSIPKTIDRFHAEKIKMSYIDELKILCKKYNVNLSIVLLQDHKTNFVMFMKGEEIPFIDIEEDSCSPYAKTAYHELLRWVELFGVGFKYH